MEFAPGGATPAAIIEACGIIPDFFCAACLETKGTEIPQTLDSIAEAMDEQYQFGGFRYPFGGHLTPAGVYESDHDDDADLLPLCGYRFEFFECFVYDYGIAAIRDRRTGDYKIARFD